MATADSAIAVNPPVASGKARRVMRVAGPAIVGVALLSAFLTFIVLAGLTRFAPTHEVVVSLLLVNLVAVFALCGIIAREAWQLMQARRRGQAAARLHVRIVALFCFVAAVPAILVATVASVTLDRGLDQLFSGQNRALVENSMRVSEAYVNEHAQMVRADVVAMATDLSRAKPLFDQDRARFRQVFNAQAEGRGFANATIIGRDLKPIEQAARRIDHDFISPTPEVLGTATEMEPQIALVLESNYIAALIKLRGYDDAYLYVVRLLDPQVIAQLLQTRASVLEYSMLEARRLGVQVAFALMYAVIALIVLLSAVWIGINFANYMVAPIRRLINAAQAVSSGNLYVEVPTRTSEGDLGQLGATFNRMTADLRTQRDDLVRARDLIDSRRLFTEAVLAGASAGVIGVGPDGRVTILNRSAERLLGTTEATALGLPLAEIVPELADVIASARLGSQRLAQAQITLSRDGQEQTLSVRVTSERASEVEHGYVVTLDNITELVAAQRTSAWADIARRIAHEIKNPLTPIQLSAERLKRKYGATIKDDPAVFLQCTDTIVRQVDDIKRMVDEFSRFARMPKAVIADEDFAETVRQVVFLMRVGHQDIDFDVTIDPDPMPARLDRRLISQALTNVIKNATEAIAAVPADHLDRGHIRIEATQKGDDIIVDVVDNGVGLPKENRNRLLEPYVTTREKGTGLGLAIVGRILEEHGGGIELADASAKYPGQRGAWMRLRFRVATASLDQRSDHGAKSAVSQ